MKKPTKKFNKGFIVMNKGERVAVISLLSVITVLLAFSVFRPAIKVSSKEQMAFHNLDSMIAAQEKAVMEQSEKQPLTLKATDSESEKPTMNSPSKKRTTKPAQASVPKASENKPTVSKTIPILDINVADSLALVALPQIGEVMASRIHRYRNRLGGFMSIDQLFEVKGMDSARFATIKPYIVIKDSNITKLDVNRDDFKTLLRHPYLEYDQVKAIVNHREHKGLIKNWEQLKGIVGEVNPLLEGYVSF